MIVIANKLTNYSLMATTMEYTSGNDVLLNKNSIFRMYDALHSPIRSQLWQIEMIDIPTYASVHFVRHNLGITHYVKSNRNTSAKVDRNTLINHLMICNAESLINICRKRLCGKADIVVQDITKMIVDEISKIDHDLAVHLVPTCQYRNGYCPEKNPCGKNEGRTV